MLTDTAEKLTQEKGQLLEEQARYKSDVKTLTTTVERLNKEKAELLDETAKYQSETNKLTATVEKLQQEQAQLLEEQAGYKSEVETLTTTVEHLNKEKDEKEKQLVDVRATLKNMTTECEHYKIAHDKMQFLDLLMRQENESIVMLNWYIKMNMSRDHPEVARKYLISGEEIEPTLQTVISTLELFEECIITVDIKREVSESSIAHTKSGVVEYVQNIQEWMKKWRDHDRNEENWYYLKYVVTRLFYYCYHVIQHHSLSTESQSVPNMMDFLTYSQDLMTKEIHPMMTSEGGWSKVMKITATDRRVTGSKPPWNQRWNLRETEFEPLWNQRETEFEPLWNQRFKSTDSGLCVTGSNPPRTESFRQWETELEQLKLKREKMKEMKEESEEMKKKSQESVDYLLLASGKQ